MQTCLLYSKELKTNLVTIPGQNGPQITVETPIINMLEVKWKVNVKFGPNFHQSYGATTIKDNGCRVGQRWKLFMSSGHMENKNS